MPDPNQIPNQIDPESLFQPDVPQGQTQQPVNPYQPQQAPAPQPTQNSGGINPEIAEIMNTPDPQKPSFWRKKPVMIALVVLVAVGLLAGAFFMIRSQNNRIASDEILVENIDTSTLEDVTFEDQTDTTSDSNDNQNDDDSNKKDKKKTSSSNSATDSVSNVTRATSTTGDKFSIGCVAVGYEQQRINKDMLKQASIAIVAAYQGNASKLSTWVPASAREKTNDTKLKTAFKKIKPTTCEVTASLQTTDLGFASEAQTLVTEYNKTKDGKKYQNTIVVGKKNGSWKVISITQPFKR